MDVTTAVTVCFRKHADFTGRASQAEFWWGSCRWSAGC